MQITIKADFSEILSINIPDDVAKNVKVVGFDYDPDKGLAIFLADPKVQKEQWREEFAGYPAPAPSLDASQFSLPSTTEAL